MMLDTVIFVFSAIVAVFGAVMMIGQRNPVASVLYLIVSIVAQAVLYVQLGALFLSAVLIIVYAGAILVLFLFVIMLLNLRSSEDLGEGSTVLSKATKYVVSVLFVIEMAMVVRSGLFAKAGPIGIMPEPSTHFGAVDTVAELLYSKYLYPFELTSILLLAAIVGAVVIARRHRPEDPSLEEEKGQE
ncbi:MAG TPA: NADH-quinone oxidoreductase subunit J [candidate division Zixibacteria bacterium]|nr:NADH-quinone oxidoreductase subunit J [candidate division Zixibacteria bacterium]